MSEQVSSYKPFGLRTYVEATEVRVTSYCIGKKAKVPGKRKDITVGVEMIDKWKVISSRSGHEHAAIQRS